ncbi:hypothetical protein PENTCL1PPCAC_9906 [Pristionchus entomophagus]|uniref:t-SNARE coiled-coil homology domain-containing protein n=1 Tax=Pristionchus entomophagus TaxID=358040 RepID=A0AAV5SWL5_9BILA|nr:hypothetical protein PENTCL1PPCAC_9906 [Pristionchus entomophagus]
MISSPYEEKYQPSKYATGSTVKSFQRVAPADEDMDYYEKEIEKYMQESLESTERSRRHLETSEKTGVATAQQLLEQREKLERTEQNLDMIHKTAVESQHHLNSLKNSFTGFFKNKLLRKPKSAKTAVPADNSLDESASSLTSSKAKSAVRLANTTEMVTTLQATPTRSAGMGPSLSEQSRATIKGTRWETMDQQVDDNLDAMADTLKNLKSIGTALGSEVEDQNKMLDRIQDKADKSDAIVRKQDERMKKILNGKGIETEKKESIVPTPVKYAMTAVSNC